MSIQIRPAVNEDLPAILLIVNHAIEFTTANYNYEPQMMKTQQDWFKSKTAAGFPVIVATDQSGVVGFGTYGTFREKIGYRFTVEHSVYVSEKRVSQGIGKLLLNHLILTAKSEGYHTMIGGIDASNTASIAFHSKLGFTECGIIREAAYKFDRWLDLMFMQLILK